MPKIQFIPSTDPQIQSCQAVAYRQLLNVTLRDMENSIYLNYKVNLLSYNFRTRYSVFSVNSVHFLLYCYNIVNVVVHCAPYHVQILIYNFRWWKNPFEPNACSVQRFVLVYIITICRQQLRSNEDDRRRWRWRHDEVCSSWKIQLCCDDEHIALRSRSVSLGNSASVICVPDHISIV